MTDLYRAPSATADWLTEALAVEATAGATDVEGAHIAYRTWASSGSRDIMLVHGGGAHGRWWDAVAPYLVAHGRVAALDLSGHGDSDHRDDYSLETWGAEVLAVIAESRLVNPIVVGHSLGGLITMALMRAPGTSVGEAIIVDSPLGGPNAEDLPEADELRAVGTRVYATQDEAVARFRPVPAQAMIPQLAEHVGRLATRRVEGGWGWKYDRRIFTGGQSLASALPTRFGRLSFFRSEFGLVSPAVRIPIEAAGGSYVELPAAGHAPMLDHPLALVTGIRTTLAAWDRGQRA